MQGQTTLVLTLLLLGFSCLTSGTTDVATRTTLIKVQRDYAEIKRDNTELKRDNAELKRDHAEFKKEIADLRHLLTRGLAVQVRHTMKPYGLDNVTTSAGGATYIRWGRTSCPAESNLVYKGQAGGSDYSYSGAATNHVCLPEDPQFSTTVLPSTYAVMYGAEYETQGVIFRSDLQEQDAPCAVCRSPTRSSAIMIPARTSCYPGLHQEYNGYLMAGNPTFNAGSEYICVDADPEAVPGGASNQNGDLLYFTAGRCGSLKCPPYIQNRVLPCVVCSQ